jgi:hypothetical protein
VRVCVYFYIFLFSYVCIYLCISLYPIIPPKGYLIPFLLQGIPFGCEDISMYIFNNKESHPHDVTVYAYTCNYTSRESRVWRSLSTFPAYIPTNSSPRSNVYCAYHVYVDLYARHLSILVIECGLKPLFKRVLCLYHLLSLSESYAVA